MMKKIGIVLGGIALVGMSATTFAAKPVLEALADVGDGICFTAPDAGGAFLAAWVYENGTSQTKWGGDLACTVSGAYEDDSIPFIDVEVDIDMSIFEGWEPIPGPGTAWYGCDDSTGQGAGEEGECLSAGYGLGAEIEDILNDKFGADDVSIIVTSCSLGLKAIEPGNGPQNYPKATIPCTYIPDNN